MSIPLDSLAKQARENATIFKPVFFRLKNESDVEALNQLFSKENNIEVFDEILGQVEEYVKCKNPKKVFTKNELTELAKKHIGDLAYEKYGVWVYYGWSKKIVHLLDENEFVEVRTNRNQYKITPQEKQILSQKKIGVIGLSVGQSVSVTLAMERICGELRLTDYDILELSNLNRIRTGVHNLGLPKVISVAREIAEIDPYLKVNCYPEGLTKSNMKDFFTEGGNLDLLIEESDGLDMKILSRYMARDLRIPVIMEASDKCMVDVERFDLENDRSILHGLVDHLDITILKKLKTNEEKIPFMLDILGLDTASLRLKASMLEIEQSINTWPQLASAVTMGGGITADVSRRLLLNQYTESGRYHIDIEELIGNKKIKKNNETSNKVINFDFPELQLNEMQKIANLFINKETSEIDEKDALKIMEAAIAAPSAGNNQPWKWLMMERKLFLFHNKKQSISWADYKNLISYISLGTAIENVNLKSAELGYQINSTLFPVSNNEKLIAAFSFKKNSIIPTDDLHSFLMSRCTNRKRGQYLPIEEKVFEEIKNNSEIVNGTSFNFTSDKTEIEKIGKIVAVAERIRLLNPQGHHDFYTKEIKWNDKGDEKITEGLDIKTLELNYTDEIGLRVASNPKIIELLNKWKLGHAFEKLSYKSISTSSAIGLLTMPAFNETNWVNGGRAVQRAWLTATKHHLAFQPISAPLFLYLQMRNGGLNTFSSSEKQDLENCYDELIKIFPCLDKNAGLFMFRLSHAGAPQARALRKTINEIFYKN